MKRIIIVLFASLLMSSCQSLDLSCDPLINDWAKENIKRYESYNREQIVQLPLSRQKAIYRGLSGNKKLELWRGKFEMTLIDETLSKPEKEQLLNLLNNLSAKLFDNTKEWERFQPYLKEWESTMRTKYNWNETKLFIYCHTWLSESELRNAILYDSIITKTQGLTPGLDDENENKKCSCLTDAYCAYSEGYYKCEIENNKCEINGGCGLLGQQDCTGTCK